MRSVPYLAVFVLFFGAANLGCEADDPAIDQFNILCDAANPCPSGHCCGTDGRCAPGQPLPSGECQHQVGEGEGEGPGEGEGEGEGSPDPDSVVIAMVETPGDSPLTIVAASSSGDAIGVVGPRDAAGLPSGITQAVYLQDDGSGLVLDVGADLRPLAATLSDGSTLEFSEWNEAIVRLRIDNAEGQTVFDDRVDAGAVSVARLAQLAGQPQDKMSPEAASRVGRYLEVASLGLGIATCAVGITVAATGVGIPAAVVAIVKGCGGLLLKLTGWVLESALAEAGGIGLEVGACVADAMGREAEAVLSCTSAAASVAAALVGEGEGEGPGEGEGEGPAEGEGEGEPVCNPTGWSAAGEMRTARDNNIAVRLLDGRVLVAGGRTSGDRLLSSSELYDPSTETWSETGAMSQAGYVGAAVLLPTGRVLAMGGSYTTRAEVFEPEDGQWSPVDPMSTGRAALAAVLLSSGDVLVVGGGREVDGVYPPSAEVFDPDEGRWSDVASMATGRMAPTATLLPSGRVLVVGGYGPGDRQFASAEVFDPAHNEWVPTGAMAHARSHHSATLLRSGHVLVAGGHNGDSHLVSAELYDPETGGWTPTGSMTTARAPRRDTVLLPSGHVLVAVAPRPGSESTEIYDPDAGAWFPGPPALQSRAHASALVVLSGGRILLAGGNRGASGSSYVRASEVSDCDDAGCPAGMVTGGAGLCIDEVFQNADFKADGIAECATRGPGGHVCSVAEIDLAVAAGYDPGNPVADRLATTDETGCCCPCGAPEDAGGSAQQFWAPEGGVHGFDRGMCECWSPRYPSYVCCLSD